MAIVREFQSACFSNDMLTDSDFEGFTDGDTWNEWACPYFNYDVAEDILKASQKNGYRWFYDADTDSFLVSHSEDPEDFPPERFRGTSITVNGRETVVYAIGAYSWTWEICECHQT